MRSGLYTLDASGTPQPARDVRAWGEWFEGPNHRIVAQDEVDDAMVSTVFLGVDHAFFGGPPVLWETMVFGGEHDGYQDRYTSQEAAIIGHATVVAALVARVGLDAGVVAEGQA